MKSSVQYIMVSIISILVYWVLSGSINFLEVGQLLLGLAFFYALMALVKKGIKRGLLH